MAIYGKIEINSFTSFRYTKDDENSEIYGWVEKDGAIVKGYSGWYRTINPETAFKICEAKRKSELKS